LVQHAKLVLQKSTFLQPSVQMKTFWQTSRFLIDLGRPVVMGIVNATPDSFSDGGHYFAEGDPSRVLAHCDLLLQEGADMLDIGGESTRPGSPPLPLAQELARVMPVLRHAVTLGVPVSVDTYKPEVMQAALDLGVDIINDVWALRRPGAQQVVAAHPRCGVCLMHMHRDPLSMQVAPMEGSVLPAVRTFLQSAAQSLLDAGVERKRVVLDPGIGFGKTVAQNFELLQRQAELLSLGYPLMAGWSRKSALGAVCAPAGSGEPLPMSERLLPSVLAALLAAERGARVLRVHDVGPTVQALKVWTAATRPAPIETA
jgi:dihydropteroate synthase